MINIKNYNKKYGKKLVAKNININVKKGDIVGFIGKNGAGKSTTIKALMNIIFPTSGSLYIDKIDCVEDSKKVKLITSYMPSELQYPSNIKVIDTFKLEAKLYGKDLNYALDLAKFLELDLYKKVEELSLGNKKKVGIINCLIRTPKVIILDEPTSGLDPVMKDKFFNLLLKEKEKGTTIFLSSHNLIEIERYCDNVFIIKDGMILKDFNLNQIKGDLKYNIKYVDDKEKVVEYLFNGNINEVIKELSNMNIVDVEIRKQTIEEIFQQYYMEEK